MRSPGFTFSSWFHVSTGTAALLAMLFVSLTPRPAEACSAACFEPIVAPRQGGSLPASAPGILVELGSSGGTTATAGFELRDAAGTLIAGALKKDAATSRTYFAPTTVPLAQGEYTIRLNNPCGGTETPPLESTINVTAAKPLPTSSGTLRVAQALRAKSSASTVSGSCTEPVDAGMVDFALDVDALAQPYLGVLSWETKVDGNYWSRSEGVLAEPGVTSLAHSLLRVFTPCDSTGTKGRHPGVTEGIHDVEVNAVLVGGLTKIAPAKIRVKVTCGADNGEVVPQAITPEPATPVTTTPTPPPGGQATSSPPSTPGTGVGTTPSNADGCAASSSGSTRSSSFSALAVALALGTILVRRRRVRTDS